MRSSWENFLGHAPTLYARKILKECGFKEPPICEKTIVDYLGLELKEFSLGDLPQGRRFREVVKVVCSWLQREADGQSRIWVHKELRREWKRLSIFHECGHAILPWHGELDYLCCEKDIDPTVQNRIEREAFRCGAELLLPRAMFVQDIRSLETGISAIEQLRSRYVALLEATAILYASAHPDPCGIVMVEPAGSPRRPILVRNPARRGLLLLPLEGSPPVPPCGGSPFQGRFPPDPLVVQPAGQHPLRVKYFVKSPRFLKYIPPGTGIGEGTPIFQAWVTGKPVRDEIHASAFGSLGRWVYQAECIPLGNTGKVLVRLWLPDPQMKLHPVKEVVL